MNAIIEKTEVTDCTIEWHDGRLEPDYQIRYALAPNGNYIVSLIGTNQKIVVLPCAFLRILPDISRDAVLGTNEVNFFQVKDLGFLVIDPLTGKVAREVMTI